MTIEQATQQHQQAAQQVVLQRQMLLEAEKQESLLRGYLMAKSEAAEAAGGKGGESA